MNLTSFTSPEFWTIRAAVVDGKPFFHGKDVATALGYARARDAIATHCKGGVVLPLPSSGGIQDTTFIPEADLYRLIMRSRLPAAERFQDWVVEEILPEIRKTGAYGAVPQSLPEALRLAADLAEERDRLQQRVIEQAPAVEYVERFVKADGLFGIRETAKILGIRQREFVAACIEDRILFREHGSLQPYAQWMAAEYFAVKVGENHGHAFKQVRFTAKGVEWVQRRLIPKRELAGVG